jgi:hypothetical protein
MAKLIHWIVIGACVLVVLGFATFAADELNKGSKQQVTKVTDGGRATTTATTKPLTEAERERKHGSVREAIDDANDVLLAPFNGVVGSDNTWVEHGIPALLALLCYGVLVALIANSLPKPKAHGGDWRTA